MTDETRKGPQKATKMLPKDPNFEIKQAGMWRGHDGTPAVIHGLYRRELDASEMEVAKALVNDWQERYGLDGGLDLVMAWEAATNFVKGRRAAPDEGRDHNQKDAKAMYARLFREFIESMGLNRKNRKGEADGDAALAAIKAIVKKRDGPVIDTVPGEDGVHRPAEGDSGE